MNSTCNSRNPIAPSVFKPALAGYYFMFLPSLVQSLIGSPVNMRRKCRKKKASRFAAAVRSCGVRSYRIFAFTHALRWPFHLFSVVLQLPNWMAADEECASTTKECHQTSVANCTVLAAGMFVSISQPQDCCASTFS